MEVSQEIPTPKPISPVSSAPDNLKGESAATRSPVGDEVEDMKSAGAKGIEIDSCVLLSDCVCCKSVHKMLDRSE